MKLYSIYDSKVNAFNDPFSMQTDGSAERAFLSQFFDPEAPVTLRLNLKDYSLYYVGEFDSDTAVITNETPPRLVLDGATVEAD